MEAESRCAAENGGATKASPGRRVPKPRDTGYGPPPRGEASGPAEEILVTKRDGQTERFSIGKIESRLRTLSAGLCVNLRDLVKEVDDGVYSGIRTAEIDRLAARRAHERITDHPDYDVLAARLVVSNHQKETMPLFSAVMRVLHQSGQLRDDFMEAVDRWHDELDAAIDDGRDNLLTYFGFRTFEHTYALRVAERGEDGVETSRIYERPQHMWMRVALALHKDTGLDAVLETYDWMSCLYFTHASPTLFNAGTVRQQLASCFLVATKETGGRHADSIEGIYQTLLQTAVISKNGGGIGMHISTVRAEGSPIESAGRPANGIIPMLQPFEATANYVDQGRKRKGAIAVYLEVWHADVLDFLRLKENTPESKRWKETGKARCRDLHLALMVPDLFMARAERGETWSLMCPFYCPDLPGLYGEAFERRYLEYETRGAPYVRGTIAARTLMERVCKAQIHTGEPYMLYKDAINYKSNQSNLGTIRSSNLCVHGDTCVLTRDGYVPIGPLEDRQVDVWNGHEWSEVTVRRTGSGRELLRLAFSNGSTLQCTPEHTFYVVGAARETQKTTAGALTPGDELVGWSLPADVNCALPGVEAEQTSGVRLVGVQRVRGRHDTFCFTEPRRGTGMFEGVLAGNCAEIVQYSDSSKTAVCNLASVSLKSFVVDGEDGPVFDYDSLRYVVRVMTRNLDRVIDITYYPTEECRRSNLSERPMGIGVQGLADALIAMRVPYDSPEADELNRDIFETIYYAAIEQSCELAEEAGEPYPSYWENGGCPAAHGKLQFDLWRERGQAVELSGRWDWDALKSRIARHGLRNSLVTCVMPTASTSQLLGNNESWEPYTNNLYVRTVLSGSYKVVTRQMLLDLIEAGLWTPELKQLVIARGGCIQDLAEIPEEIRRLYQTSFELSQRRILDQARIRAPFVDQSISQNCHMTDATVGKVSSYHMYAWKLGLKTGLYYLRGQQAKEAVKVSVAPELLRAPVPETPEDDAAVGGEDGWVCTKEEGCVSCSG